MPGHHDRRTIDRRLDGEVVSGKEKEYCSVLTNEEESLLVRYPINKARALQPVRRKDLNEMIIQMLTLRVLANKRMKGGRKYIPLSNAAKLVLKNKQAGFSFWSRFDQKHRQLSKRNPSPVNLKRVLACTKEMAISHLDDLAEELISTRIFTNAIKKAPGIWEGNIDMSRIYNHDETPQFVKYGEGGAAPELVYCPKGEECKKAVAENRECVTIHPFVCFDGSLVICHVIFKGETLTSKMITSGAVEKIKNLLISSTENGSQDGRSCLAVYKFFATKVISESKKPCVILTDGHSSRFDYDVMSFCGNNNLYQFMGKPDSTHVTQLLDQINAALHEAYRCGSKNLFRDDENINRPGFLDILASIWEPSGWASEEAITNAAKRVGISQSGLNWQWMQVEKFAASESVIENDEEPEIQTESIPGPSWQAEPPSEVRAGSKLYYKIMYERQLEISRKQAEIPISPEEVGLLEVQKIKRTKAKTTRLNVSGSMEGQKILERVQEIHEEEELKKAEREARQQKKLEKNDAFIHCETQCVCAQPICLAKGLRRCTQCRDVMKSKCSKKGCKEIGVLMDLPFCDRKKR